MWQENKTEKVQSGIFFTEVDILITCHNATFVVEKSHKISITNLKMHLKRKHPTVNINNYYHEPAVNVVLTTNALNL